MPPLWQRLCQAALARPSIYTNPPPIHLGYTWSMAKVDWDYWRQKFVTGDQSLKELSEGHNAPAFKTLRNRSSAEDWPEQRKKFRDMKRTQAATLPDVQQTADEVKKIIDTAEMLTRHAQMSKAFQSLGAAWLETLKLPNSNKLDPAKVAKLKAGEVATFLKWSVDTERMVEGLATQRQEIDLSGMSDAELEKIANGGL
jgi:hypothetical protein